MPCILRILRLLAAKRRIRPKRDDGDGSDERTYLIFSLYLIYEDFCVYIYTYIRAHILSLSDNDKI